MDRGQLFPSFLPEVMPLFEAFEAISLPDPEGTTRARVLFGSQQADGRAHSPTVHVGTQIHVQRIGARPSAHWPLRGPVSALGSGLNIRNTAIRSVIAIFWDVHEPIRHPFWVQT